jgi:hypothetical protein
MCVCNIINNSKCNGVIIMKMCNNNNNSNNSNDNGNNNNEYGNSNV